MKYQQLGLSDGPALAALLAAEPHVASYASHAEDVLQSNDYEVWGGYGDTALVGAVVMAVGPFDAEIESLVVSAAVRRKGVGRALIEHAVTRARAVGKERILLEVREGNEAALALYKRVGFKEDGRRAQYYAPLLEGQTQREAACLMSCLLA